jgi:hypothetical protein
MRTHSKSGFRVPTQQLNLLATPSLSISPLPKTYEAALLDPNWAAAVREEFSALLQNDTWQLVPRPPSANIVSGKWVFRQKFHSDGSLSAIKLAGFVVVSLSSMGLTTMKLSLLLLSPAPFAQYSV